jgi:hypothetical protein
LRVQAYTHYVSGPGKSSVFDKWNSEEMRQRWDKVGGRLERETLERVGERLQNERLERVGQGPRVFTVLNLHLKLL